MLQFTYMKNIEAISRVIIRRGEQVLLCKNKEQGRYFLPGGHVEFGDTMADTVYKELNEEMGLEKEQIENLEYFDVLENFYGEGEERRHEINFIFKADLAEGGDTSSKEEQIDFEWKNLTDLENINFLPKEMIFKIKKI